MAGSFKTDILPMFRDIDIEHMADPALDVHLDDYKWMSDPAHAQNVYDRLSGKKKPRMPPGGPFWTADKLKKLSDWMNVDPKFEP